MNKPVRRKRLRLQFSLRSLLIASTVVAILLAIAADRRRRVERAHAVIRQVGGVHQLTVGSFADDSISARIFRMIPGASESSPSAVYLLAQGARVHISPQIAGSPSVDYANNAGRETTNDDLDRLCALTGIKELHVDSSLVSDRGLAHLTRLRNLEKLSLSGIDCSDAGFAHLSRLTALRSLSVRPDPDCDFTGSGLAYLQSLDNLSKLTLSGARIDDQTVRHLSSLTGLRELTLRGTNITDRAISDLKRLRSLQRLILVDTLVTFEGYSELLRALPKCDVRRK